MVERESKDVPLRTQARILSLNRSGLYYKPAGPSEEEVRLKHRIDRPYTRTRIIRFTAVAASHRSSGSRAWM